jgi:hypothetical protein
MSNFCIQQLVHFYFKNWRKFDSKKVKLNWFLQTGAPAHDVARAAPRWLAVPGPRAHAEAPE